MRKKICTRNKMKVIRSHQPQKYKMINKMRRLKL